MTDQELDKLDEQIAVRVMGWVPPTDDYHERNRPVMPPRRYERRDKPSYEFISGGDVPDETGKARMWRGPDGRHYLRPNKCNFTRNKADFLTAVLEFTKTRPFDMMVRPDHTTCFTDELNTTIGTIRDTDPDLLVAGCMCMAEATAEGGRRMSEYIIIENGNKSTPNIPERPDDVYTGFKTIAEAGAFILADADAGFDPSGVDEIGVEADWGNRYTICEVIRTVQPQPTLSVKFALRKCKATAEGEGK